MIAYLTVYFKGIDCFDNYDCLICYYYCFCFYFCFSFLIFIDFIMLYRLLMPSSIWLFTRLTLLLKSLILSSLLSSIYWTIDLINSSFIPLESNLSTFESKIIDCTSFLFNFSLRLCLRLIWTFPFSLCS